MPQAPAGLVIREQAFCLLLKHTQLVNVDYLTKYDRASRGDLNKLLWNKLSDFPKDGQKETKIGNLLIRLRSAGIIVNDGSR